MNSTRMITGGLLLCFLVCGFQCDLPKQRPIGAVVGTPHTEKPDYKTIESLFTGVAVLTLAIGIGATTAIFIVIDGVLLKPLPYPRSGELVALDHSAPGLNIPRAGAAPFLYFTYREEGRVFQDVGLWNTGTVSVINAPIPESYANNLRAIQINLTWTSGNITRTRQMTSYVSRYGLQNYVY